MRNRAKRKNDSSKGKRLLSVARVMPRAVKDSLGGWGSAYVLALVALFAYPVAMFTEIDPIERELLARLRAGVYHA